MYGSSYLNYLEDQIVRDTKQMVVGGKLGKKDIYIPQVDEFLDRNVEILMENLETESNMSICSFIKFLKQLRTCVCFIAITCLRPLKVTAFSHKMKFSVNCEMKTMQDSTMYVGVHQFSEFLLQFAWLGKQYSTFSLMFKWHVMASEVQE